LVALYKIVLSENIGVVPSQSKFCS